MNFSFIKNLKLLILINILIVNNFYYKDYLIIRIKNNNNIKNKNYNVFNNNFNYLKKMFNKINNLKVVDVRYSYSFKYNIMKIEYSIGLYDEEDNLILPNDISLYYNYSLICNIMNEYYNISIDSLANIKNNKYFNCIEFNNLNERITLGIKIYNILKNNINNYILLFTDDFFNYNIMKYNFDNIFNSLVLMKNLIQY